MREPGSNPGLAQPLLPGDVETASGSEASARSIWRSNHPVLLDLVRTPGFSPGPAAPSSGRERPLPSHAVNLFRFIPGYEDEIFVAGKEPLLLLLLSFLLAFALTRLYTRLARRHGWGSGRLAGVHVHHMVPGLVLVLLAGMISFSSYRSAAVVDVCAIAFGIGAALVLDEFALVFHLDDVYWEHEGRQSVVAAVLGAAAATLMLVVTAPFGIHNGAFGERSRLFAFAYLASNSLYAIVSLLKGKPFVGLAAIFFPFVGLVGAVRLAHPASPWAHLFYDEHKRERARERFRHCPGQRMRNRVVNALGGFQHGPHSPGA